MIETFEYDKRTASICRTKRSARRRKAGSRSVEKREGKWSDIRTVYAAIGQDTVVVTPISMLRAVSSVGVTGKMYTPHFLKEFKPIGAVGDEDKIRTIFRRATVLRSNTPNRS